MIALAALLAAAPPLDRDQMIERCGNAVVAAMNGGREPGMLDLGGASFELLSIEGVEPNWVLYGSYIEAPGADGSRLAHRFRCAVKGKARPRVTFGKVIRVPASATGGRP